MAEAVREKPSKKRSAVKKRKSKPVIKDVEKEFQIPRIETSDEPSTSIPETCLENENVDVTKLEEKSCLNTHEETVDESEKALPETEQLASPLVEHTSTSELPPDPGGAATIETEEHIVKKTELKEQVLTEPIESVCLNATADSKHFVSTDAIETEEQSVPKNNHDEQVLTEPNETVCLDTKGDSEHLVLTGDLIGATAIQTDEQTVQKNNHEEQVLTEPIEHVAVDVKADSKHLRAVPLGPLESVKPEPLESVRPDIKAETECFQIPLIECGIGSLKVETTQDTSTSRTNTIETCHSASSRVVTPSEDLIPVQEGQCSKSTNKVLTIAESEKTLASIVAAKHKERTEEKKDKGVSEKVASQEKVVHRKIYHEAVAEKIFKPMTMQQVQALYYNQQLAKNPEIIENFILNEGKKENHEFYEILLNYFRSRNNLLCAEDDIKILQNTYSHLTEEVWITTTHSVTAQGQCGDGSKVTATRLYQMCKLNGSAQENLSKILLKIREEVQEKLSLYAYSSQLSRLQVESYLHSFLQNSPALRNIPKNAPVQAALVQKAEYTHQVRKLKDCIAVLFMFHRRPIKDRDFRQNLRTWTQKLVAALLRLATFEDHLFILNHVLRCPAGVGKWATQLIQVPPPPTTDSTGSFGSPLLDHLVTALSTLLQPIIARDEFMSQMRTSVTPQSLEMENTWILVDSDGEEDEDPSNIWLYLHENDIVSILKQFPVTLVFAHVLRASVLDSGNVDYDIHHTTEAVMIRVFAFATTWVTILGGGLKTYSMARYRQLNKRLGKMIRHTVSFVSDHWLNFKANNVTRLPPVTLERLQLEFDHFFMRATDCILNAQKLGSWQFMAEMPYTCVSSDSMWQLLYILHQGQSHSLDIDSLPNVYFCRGYLKDPDSREQLADNLMNLQTSETIYLLTTFANMAQCRTEAESEFIQTIAFDVFEISYVCNHTREFCSKVGRELLYTIVIKHPFILSLLLQRVNEVMPQVGMMSLYLFQDLPIQKWMPSDPDMVILRQWLLTNDLSHAENQLARVVLNHMNWNISEQTGKPVLPIRLHRQVAMLIVEAYNKYISNRNMSSLIGEGIRQMASVVRQNQTSEQHFNNWAWDLILKLKLHNYTIVSHTQALTEDFCPPDIVKDDWLLPLVKGVTQKNPMACYVALIMSNIGHDISSFAREGMDHLQNLLACNQFTAAIHVMSCVVHHFYQTSHYFLQSDGFQKVLQTILSADESLFKIAKSVLSYDFPGAITKQLTDMIQKEIFEHLSDGNAASIIVFWLTVLMKSSRATSDRNFCFVIDSLIRCTFTLRGTYTEIEDVFSKSFQTLLKSDKGRGVVSSVVSWIASGTTMPSLMERSSMPEFTWLAYMILHTEGVSEICSNFWLNVQQEMHNNPKMPAEQALRLTVTKLKLEQAPTLQRLNIYRWAQQALDSPVDHPLLPLLYQRFFNLYLSRLVTDSSLPQRASIGERFFDSMSYSSMLKKMKKRLAEAADYHSNFKPESDQSTSKDHSGTSAEMHQKLARLYRTFSLWLDEPRLHDANLYLPALPLQYESARLLQIFQMQMDPWMDLVDLDGVQYLLSIGAQNWKKVVTSPLDPNPKDLQGEEQQVISAAERIVHKLRNTESVEDPPSLSTLTAPVPEITSCIVSEKSLFMHLITSDLIVLRDYTRVFAARTAHHCAVDEAYMDLVPDLYSNQVKELTLTIECQSLVNPLHRCCNPAIANVRVEEKTRNDIIQRKMDENRAEYKQVMIEGLLPPPQNVCIAAVHVENAITILIKLCQSSTDDDYRDILFDIASSLFFHLASMVNDETNFYPPTKQFFSSCIEILGKEFVSRDPKQTLVVLQACLEQPSLSGLISSHFVPMNSPKHFVEMYEQLIHILQQQNMDLVFMLLTKFDVWSWLENMKPQVDTQRFIDILGSALMACGAEPDKKTKLVFDLYCGHLQIFLQNNFPRNVTDVINILLQGSTSERLHVQCWEIVCTECFLAVHQITPPGKRKKYIQFKTKDVEACNDTLLGTTQVKEILHWFGSYFLHVRLNDPDASTFGLYPKLGRYIVYIAQFIGGFSRSFVTKMMPNLKEMNPYQVIELIWQQILEVFSPWIQHLGNQEQILFPWIEGDTMVAMPMVSMFRKVVEYFISQLSVCAAEYSTGVLALLLMYYVTGLCTKTTPRHISKLYLHEFNLLPWESLRPDLQLLETLAQMKERTSPNCFKLVSHLLPRLAWPEIMQYYQMCQPPEIVMRFQAALLLLLVQTYGDFEMLEQLDTVQLLTSAENFDWNYVTMPSFQASSNWFLQVCDAKCVLSERSSPAALGLRLLKVAAGFNSRTDVPWSDDLSSRRLIYLHTIIQLMCQCTYITDVKMDSIGTVIVNLLTEIEMVESSVIEVRTRQEESLDLIKELLSLLNNCNPDGPALNIIMMTITQWLQDSPHSILLTPCIKAASRCLASLKQMVQIMEACIEVFFTPEMDSAHGNEWDQILEVIQMPELNVDECIKEAIEEGSYLLLHAHTLQQAALCQNYEDEAKITKHLVEWSSEAKPNAENEGKMLLWWHKLLQLFLKQLHENGSKYVFTVQLSNLVTVLQCLGEDRASSGLLGVIGLGKKSILSVRFRIICRTLAAFISSHILVENTLTLLPEQRTAINALAKQTKTSVLSLKSNKQYSMYKDQILMACVFVNDPVMTLQDSLALIEQLANAFFPDKYYLKVVQWR